MINNSLCPLNTYRKRIFGTILWTLSYRICSIQVVGIVMLQNRWHTSRVMCTTLADIITSYIQADSNFHLFTQRAWDTILLISPLSRYSIIELQKWYLPAERKVCTVYATSPKCCGPQYFPPLSVVNDSRLKLFTVAMPLLTHPADPSPLLAAPAKQ